MGYWKSRLSLYDSDVTLHQNRYAVGFDVAECPEGSDYSVWRFLSRAYGQSTVPPSC